MISKNINCILSLTVLVGTAISATASTHVHSANHYKNHIHNQSTKNAASAESQSTVKSLMNLGAPTDGWHQVSYTYSIDKPYDKD